MRPGLLVPPALLLLGACYAPQAIQVPSYEPRAVAVPAECEALVRRAAAPGATISEADDRMLSFCQHQQILRAQEEEAAARKLEAHARTAGVVLQAATFVLGATIAVLTWVF
jgi:hypothetical protein